MVTIAESGNNQASATYDQIRQAFEAGRQSEFELYLVLVVQLGRPRASGPSS